MSDAAIHDRLCESLAIELAPYIARPYLVGGSTYETAIAIAKQQAASLAPLIEEAIEWARRSPAAGTGQGERLLEQARSVAVALEQENAALTAEVAQWRDEAHQWITDPYADRHRRPGTTPAPATMLQPVSIDTETDEPLQQIALRPADESQDTWDEPAPAPAPGGDG